MTRSDFYINLTVTSLEVCNQSKILQTSLSFPTNIGDNKFKAKIVNPQKVFQLQSIPYMSKYTAV